MSVAPERRSAVLEVRAKGRRLEGYAALFGVRAQIGTISEEIRAGAFKASLAAGRDILENALDKIAVELLGDRNAFLCQLLRNGDRLTCDGIGHLRRECGVHELLRCGIGADRIDAFVDELHGAAS